ncbi:hypothetical protein AARAC_003664 [Aspergillus arachidicola]|uniref:Siderophore iron transporter mirB n=1 Tax=Aspergillus arachidicola TaxID=656916 RepID=A0A2G7GBL0_9EURO|nr:hypothetical protein AARAC_003664 [Aspergillus arachidicola]
MRGVPSDGIAKAVVPNQIAPVTKPSRDGVSISDKDSTLYQGGVQRLRAITSLWSKNTMWLMFILLYLVSFVGMLLVSVQTSLNPYITSLFYKYGLLTVVSIMSTILGGSSKLTLAKIIDIWGRVEGFLSMLLILVIGLIMKATCKNIETYVAAHTLYWVGHIGMINFILHQSRFSVGVWRFRNHDYRYFHSCSGCYAVHAAEGPEGTLEKTVSERSWWQSIIHYFIEFDVIGIVLITAVFSLILLPFRLASYAPKGWASGHIIAMEVLGVNSYFSSYLQVVHRLDITTANYVLNAFSLTSYIFNPIFGLLIRYTSEFKWTVFIGIPTLLLGTAFRQLTTHVGIITMTQILVGLCTCIFTVCGLLASMAPVTHQEIAVIVAIWGLFGSIGAAVGSAIAGGMWNNILPGELYKRLPEESRNITATIFSDMVMQMSYADGTPEREAIVGAYADVQRKMVIAGVYLVPLFIACIWVWKDINVNRLEREQTRGNAW